MPKELTKLKPFKVRRAGEAKKVGVAAFTLKELTKKACGLFQVEQKHIFLNMFHVPVCSSVTWFHSNMSCFCFPGACVESTVLFV